MALALLRTHAMKLIRGMALLTVAAGLAVAPSAQAQHAVERVQSTGPHTLMFRSGVVTLAASYVPVVVVAGFSDVPADQRLYIPVAGPWMDFAERDCPTCRHETLNKVLLVTDGIFQGLGALDIVGSFFVIEERTYVARTTTPSPAGAPVRLGIRPIGGGYGMAAVGRF
jgi:hypothetical protein